MLEVLKGDWVQLEPLNDSHRDELYAAAQDESILLPGRYVRSRDELLSTDYQSINNRMLVVLDYLSSKMTS